MQAEATTKRRRAAAPVPFSDLCRRFHAAFDHLHEQWNQLRSFSLSEMSARFPTSLRIEAIGMSVWHERDITTAMFTGAISKFDGKKHLDTFRRLKAAHAAELKRIGFTAAEKRVDKARDDLEGIAGAIVEHACSDVVELADKLIVVDTYLSRFDCWGGQREKRDHDKTLWASAFGDAMRLAGKAVPSCQ
jgi:hypothetical protein